MNHNSTSIHTFQARYDSFYTEMSKQFEDLLSSSTAAMDESENAGPNATQDENEFPHILEDGFSYTSFEKHKEVIVLDAAKDPELNKCVILAKNLLKLFSGPENRAKTLAKFVAMRLGGADPDVKEKYEAAALKACSETQSELLPIGFLLREGGLQRHRALLFKYLADRTVMHPEEWVKKGEAGDPLVCKLETNNQELKCFAEIHKDGQKTFVEVDLVSSTPGILKSSPIESVIPLPTSAAPITEENEGQHHIRIEEALKLTYSFTRWRRHKWIPTFKSLEISSQFLPLSSFLGFPNVPSRWRHLALQETCKKLEILSEKSLFADPIIQDVIYRNCNSNEPTVVLMTRCFSDIPSPNRGYELVAEGKKSELGGDLGNSLLFQMLYEIGMNKFNFVDLIQKYGGLCSIILHTVFAPPHFYLPNTRSCMALIGIKSPSIPESIPLLDGSNIRLITARLLTAAESRIIDCFGPEGRKMLAEQFEKDGTCHLTSLASSLPRPIGAGKEANGIKRKETSFENDPTHAKRARTGEAEESPSLEGRIANSSFAFLPSLEAVRRKLHPNLPRNSFSNPDVEASYLLPLLTVNFNGVLRPEARFNGFSPPSPLKEAMFNLERCIRYLSLYPNHPLYPVADSIRKVLQRQSSLANLWRLDAYAANPEEYSKFLNGQVKFSDLKGVPLGLPSAPLRGLGNFENSCCFLVNRMIQLVNWVLHWQQKAGEPFDPIFCLHLFAIDFVWKKRSETLLMDSERSLKAFTQETEGKKKEFEAFMQKIPLNFAHGGNTVNEVVAAGFTPILGLFEQDKCICRVCNEVIEGWRPWHDPWKMHNLNLHPPEFRVKVMQRIAQETLYIASQPAPAPMSLS